MNYEKVILEMLGRIQTLEEQVSLLMAEKESKSEKELERMTTNDIREYIISLKTSARESGKKTIVLIARDIHRELDLKNRYPMVCNAMRDCMNPGDTILFQPPKNNSSTVEIEYKL